MEKPSLSLISFNDISDSTSRLQISSSFRCVIYTDSDVPCSFLKNIAKVVHGKMYAVGQIDNGKPGIIDIFFHQLNDLSDLFLLSGGCFSDLCKLLRYRFCSV